MMTTTPSSRLAAVQPFHLTIRFSSSLPDLDLDIPSPQTTTVLSVKHILRNRLATRSRIRFIHQGHLLPDSAALSAAIRPPSTPPSPPLPPPPSASGVSAHEDVKGKGKAVNGGGAPTPVRIYINCSIGDELSSQELADEAAAAEKPPVEPDADQAKPSTWTRPRPRGFDRLLQTGFTQLEINTLRTQFASINNDRFTSDALPSPDTMRRLEDVWIDTNTGELPSSTDDLDDDFNGGTSINDIMMQGMMIGFFFPLGSMAWLLRQGLWAERWQVFVSAGVILSLSVGLVMNISSTH